MLIRETALIRLLGLRIPMLLLLRPRVLELTDEGCAVEIPLRWPSRNHVGSMYVGALCAGADLASGLNALRAIRAGRSSVIPIFKDMRAEFLKRADGDVVFRLPRRARRRGGGPSGTRDRRADHPSRSGGGHRAPEIRRRAGGPLHHGALGEAQGRVTGPGSIDPPRRRRPRLRLSIRRRGARPLSTGPAGPPRASGTPVAPGT